jgi:hypothetical protein
MSVRPFIWQNLVSAPHQYTLPFTIVPCIHKAKKLVPSPVLPLPSWYFEHEIHLPSGYNKKSQIQLTQRAFCILFNKDHIYTLPLKAWKIIIPSQHWNRTISIPFPHKQEHKENFFWSFFKLILQICKQPILDYPRSFKIAGHQQWHYKTKTKQGLIRWGKLPHKYKAGTVTWYHLE